MPMCARWSREDASAAAAARREWRKAVSEPNFTQSGYATYTISADGKSITCHRCTMTSWHPMDVHHRYCQECRMFHAPHIGEDARSADALMGEVARLLSENARLTDLLARAEELIARRDAQDDEPPF
jgi:hypothetical protein